MARQFIECKPYHPFPFHRWLYRQGGGEWQGIESYNGYDTDQNETEGDGGSPLWGQYTTRVYIKDPSAGCDFVYVGGNPAVPDPEQMMTGDAGTITSEIKQIVVDDFTWSHNTAGGTITIAEPPELGPASWNPDPPPHIETTEGDGTTTYDLTPYVIAYPPVIEGGWSTSNPIVTITDGVLNVPTEVGDHELTVTANNGYPDPSTTCQPFNWNLQAGLPDAPVWGTLPSPDQDDRDYPTPITLNDYCTGATSYSKDSGTGTVSGGIATLPANEIGGAYSLVVNANNEGGVEPATINWTVNETPPDIDTHPAPASGPVGSPIQFTSTASHPNTGTIIYQWQGESTPGSWQAITAFYGVVSGSTTTTVTITPAEGEIGVRNVRLSARSYRNTAANAAYSNAAALTVEGGAGNPASMLLKLTTTASPQTLSFGTQGTNNCTIKWGDGSETPYNGAGSIVHEYAVAGEHDVEINIDGGGNFSGFYVNNGGDRAALTGITQWGTSVVANCVGMFYGCSALVTTATDLMNTSSATSGRDMFRGASLANPNTQFWDVSGFTDMSHMFRGAANATPDVGAWTVNSVNTMAHMFRDAASADPEVSAWSVNNVTAMNYMFSYASNANPNVRDWNVGNVLDMSNMFSYAISATPDVSLWDTAKAINMSLLFREASAANPNVRDWNVESVTNMSYMFRGATNAYPDVSLWNTYKLTNAAYMFQSMPATPIVSGWDTSKMTTTALMFRQASNADPDLSLWEIPLMTAMGQMLDASGFSDTNYWAALLNFANQHDNVAALNPLTWHASTNVSVTLAEPDVQAAKARLVESTDTGGAGWSITDKDG